MAYPWSLDPGNLSQALAYDSNGKLIYQGLAKPGSSKSAAVWQIRKFTYDADQNLTDIQWADGDLEFNNIWDDRATLSYS
jgi:YD repeat-containing protein